MPWTIENAVVVPFDFSDHAVAAVRRAMELAAKPDSIYVLHVLPFLTPTEPGVVWGTVDDASRLTHALEAMKEALPEDEFAGVHLDVRIGDPGSVAADKAEELEADLIVVGSHGRRGISRWVLGSVAERVARLAPCPVLVVKLPVPEEPEQRERTVVAATPF